MEDIDTQKYLIDAEEEFISKHMEEYENKKKKYEKDAKKWAGNFNKNFSPDNVEWWISTLAGPVLSAIKKLGGAEVDPKEILQDTLLTKFLTLDAYATLYAYNKIKANGIEIQINKHIKLLHYHGDLAEKYTKELLETCSCALKVGGS